MGNLLAFLAFAGGFVAVLGAVAWLGVRIRRRGIGGGIMGPIDEAYHPGAHRSRLEIRVQEQRMVPVPSPDDRWRRIRGTADAPGTPHRSAAPPPPDNS